MELSNKTFLVHLLDSSILCFTRREFDVAALFYCSGALESVVNHSLYLRTSVIEGRAIQGPLKFGFFLSKVNLNIQILFPSEEVLIQTRQSFLQLWIVLATLILIGRRAD